MDTAQNEMALNLNRTFHGTLLHYYHKHFVVKSCVESCTIPTK